ncbi:MAG TPA: FAD:protein FMN transferase [Gemmatimonadales bacterium]|nr:FAD:protein FMN transferase [Gemmatimonadales bacterium]
MIPFLAALVLQSTPFTREAGAMGTTLRVEIAAPRELALEATEEALAVVERWEAILSTWRPEAELDRVNRAPAEGCVPLSPALASVLARVAEWVELTGGAFDPAIGALVDAWDLRGAGRIPSAAELGAARAASGWSRVVIESGACLRRPGGLWIDSGAFGKGLALGAALRALGAHGLDGMLDFGGQVAIAGRPRTIEVADPADRRRPGATLARIAGSAATSAQSERRVVVGGVAYGHLLDPRTGRPAPDWGSVTAVAADPFVADVLSTALFILGPDAALAWAAEHPEVGVLVLERSPARARWSASLAGRVILHPPFTPSGAH